MNARTQIERSPDKRSQRFLRLARGCRIRDLQQLATLSGLVRALSALIHALQKERGSSSIFLGSSGSEFAQQFEERVQESERCEDAVRVQLERIDQTLEHAANGTRFFGRLAAALSIWERLPGMRSAIEVLSPASETAAGFYSELIASLLAVGFEATDVAADPETSRALVALVNFAQGKEYAGQERALGGAAWSSGTWSPALREQLRALIAAQECAFRVFREFAAAEHAAAFGDSDTDVNNADLHLLRSQALAGAALEPRQSSRWYDAATQRIDRMRTIEETAARNLESLCAGKLSEALKSESGQPIEGELPTGATVAALMTDPRRGSTVYPVRSIIEVLEAQSRRIDHMRGELDTARAALAERKVIERAKGLLMRSRRLSESQAFSLLRQTAMNQNKRLFEIAEAVISMEDLLR
jgi:hypothetical protein